MINFPVYSIRNNFNIYDENDLVLIDTYYNTYTLDDKSIVADNFLERRVLMLGEEYDYPIYPLSHKCTNVIQVNREYRSSNYSSFIDKNGKVLKYKPTKSVEVTWKKATCMPSIDNMYYIAICKDEPYHFVVKEPYNYLAIISYKGGRHIYDTSMLKPEREKIWRKI